MSEPLVYGVYVARFPFLESAKEKNRPVIVLSKPCGKYKTVAVVPISSKTQKEPVDIPLTDWENAGLVKPSVARLHRLTTILSSDLTSYLGSCSAKDKAAIKQSLKKTFNL